MVGGFARSTDRREVRDWADEIVGFLDMRQKRDSIHAHDLTAFDRRKLELGRAIATRPQLLLMDEVVAGATPNEAGEMVELVKKVRDRGITVLIVEHVMKVIMGLSDRVIVMENGNLIANGRPAEVVKQPAVLRAYFGKNSGTRS